MRVGEGNGGAGNVGVVHIGDADVGVGDQRRGERVLGVAGDVVGTASRAVVRI